jgi:hypothetical protein
VGIAASSDITEAAGPESVTADLLTLLDLEIVEVNLYRTNHGVRRESQPLRGQVAAQALRPAGHTAEEDLALTHCTGTSYGQAMRRGRPSSTPTATASGGHIRPGESWQFRAAKSSSTWPRLSTSTRTASTPKTLADRTRPHRMTASSSQSRGCPRSKAVPSIRRTTGRHADCSAR